MTLLARGVWQKNILSRLQDGERVLSPPNRLTGRAKNYQGRYVRSFENMLARLRRAGYEVHRVPGPRGGEFLAEYWITKKEEDK